MNPITDRFPMPQIDAGSRWPSPDDYNKDFKTLNDYSNYINSQLQVIPKDFHDYKDWINNRKNQVIL